MNNKLLLLFLLLSVSLIGQNKKKNDWEKENLIGKVKQVTMQRFEALENGALGAKLPDHTRTTFNEQGKYISREEKYDENIGFKTLYTYGQDGLLQEEKRFQTNINTMLKRTVYVYDSQGNEINLENYNSEGILENNIVIEHKDASVEAFIYDPQGNWRGRYTIAYDAHGNETELVVYAQNGEVIIKDISIYDSKNNRIERNYSHLYQGIVTVRTYAYEFDSHGNWVKQITFNNGKPESISQRTIEYY